MEQVLLNQSRIPARVSILKPISAAIAIGTGGPFGAEGPIIATGGALGSLLGQVVKITPSERKVLLAAGAAAGMSAIFGTPVAAVLLAIELLLFEYRARSIIPVSLAAATAAAVRFATVGASPVFPAPELAQPTGESMAFYIVLGAVMGLIAVGVSRAVYDVEDGFEKLPIHWMWWPALGGLVVGLVGYFAPRTLGVGYDVIDEILSGIAAGESAGAVVRDEICVVVHIAGQRDVRRHARAAIYYRRGARRTGRRDFSKHFARGGNRSADGGPGGDGRAVCGSISCAAGVGCFCF